MKFLWHMVEREIDQCPRLDHHHRKKHIMAINLSGNRNRARVAVATALTLAALAGFVQPAQAANVRFENNDVDVVASADGTSVVITDYRTPYPAKIVMDFKRAGFTAEDMRRAWNGQSSVNRIGDTANIAASIAKSKYGWNLRDVNEGTRALTELDYLAAAMDREVKKGNRGVLNLPEEQRQNRILSAADPDPSPVTQCRGRCLTYTARTLVINTVALAASATLTIYGAAFAAPLVASLGIVIGLTTVLWNAYTSLRNAWQNNQTNLALRTAMMGVGQGLSIAVHSEQQRQTNMQQQLNDMAARLARVENHQAQQMNMLP